MNSLKTDVYRECNELEPMPDQIIKRLSYPYWIIKLMLLNKV